MIEYERISAVGHLAMTLFVRIAVIMSDQCDRECERRSLSTRRLSLIDFCPRVFLVGGGPLDEGTGKARSFRSQFSNHYWSISGGRIFL